MSWMSWIIAVVLVAAAIVGFYFSGLVIRIKLVPNEDILRDEIAAGRIDKAAFDTLPREEVSIQSPFGYKLYGLFFPVERSRKTLIIAHGVTSSLYGSIKYMNMFLKRGFNVLIYDHRRHGRSGGTDTTYGYYEKVDLKACTDWVLQKCGADGEVGILGESMGAATALQHAAIDPRAAFYVLDCPYSDFFAQVAYRLKVEYGLPRFPLLWIANLFVKLRSGMSLRQISPIRDLAGVTTPMFFIHGKEDTYIPPQMSIDMYEAKQGLKKLYLAPNADHAEAYYKNPEEYDRLVGEFLDEVERAGKTSKTAVI